MVAIRKWKVFIVDDELINVTLLRDVLEEQYQLSFATIALTHHERWNGDGYPAGLAGEEIPLIGRVVAVADVFDALTSGRPYKTAWELDRALEIMRKESGHHFDPQLIEAFFQVLPEILEIRQRWREH